MIKNILFVTLFSFCSHGILLGQKEETKNLDISWQNVSEQIVFKANDIINLIDSIETIKKDTSIFKKEKLKTLDFKNYLLSISKIDREKFFVVTQNLRTLDLTWWELYGYMEAQNLQGNGSLKELLYNLAGADNTISFQKNAFNQACAYNKAGFYFGAENNPGIEKD